MLGHFSKIYGESFQLQKSSSELRVLIKETIGFIDQCITCTQGTAWYRQLTAKYTVSTSPQEVSVLSRAPQPNEKRLHQNFLPHHSQSVASIGLIVCKEKQEYYFRKLS